MPRHSVRVSVLFDACVRQVCSQARCADDTAGTCCRQAADEQNLTVTSGGKLAFRLLLRCHGNVRVGKMSSKNSMHAMRTPGPLGYDINIWRLCMILDG